MPGVASGTLRNQLTFQRATATPDGQGGQATTWGDLLTVPGELVPVSGQEVPAAGRLVATQIWAWRIRWNSGLADLTPKDRFIDEDGNVFEILTVVNRDELNRKNFQFNGRAVQKAA